ncbi:MAG: tape measure protein [Telluria sp.]
MIDISTIGIRFDTSGLTAGQRALRDAEQAANRTADAADRTGERFSALSSATSMAAKAFALLGGALLVREFIQAADAIALMDARLKLATTGARDFAQAQKDVYRIAQANNVGLVETATLYTKLSEPIRNLGGGTREVAGIVDAFATTLRISGASTQEAAAATMQFAQAMGSGKLSGDEFRSMAETSPRFMKALADGMGVPTGKLKEMAAEGKLTADVVGNSLVAALAKLKEEAKSLPGTVGGAMTNLKTDVLLAIDAINKSSGASLGLTDVIETAQRLIPVVRDELTEAFQSVSGWIDGNREKLGEVWDITKSIIGDAWEVAKAVGSIVGFLTEWGVQSGAVQVTMIAIRYLIAGFQDGVKILGAGFATLGSLILKTVLSPLQLVLTASAKIAGVFDDNLAAKIKGVKVEIAAFADAGMKYNAGVVAAFSAGDSAVGRLTDSIGGVKIVTDAANKSAQDAAVAFKALKPPKAGPDDKAIKAANAELEKQKKLMAELAGVNGDYMEQLSRLQVLRKTQNMSEERYIELVTELIGKQSGAKKAIDEQEKALKKEADATKKAADEYEKLFDRMTGDTQKLLDQVDAQKEYNERIGLTTKAVADLDSAKMDHLATIADESAALADAIDWSGKMGDQYRDQAAALRELASEKRAGATKQTIVDEAKKAQAEWKKAAESIEQSLTDALMRGFESGKSFGRNLMDTLTNMFKTLILRPIISAVVNPVAGAIAGGMGASGAANAATSGISSGVGSALGIGASMSAFGGTLATGFMNTIAGTGFSASLTAGSSLMAGGATASGAGMIVGALAPIALGIAAAVAIWKKLDTSGTYHTGGASSASSAGVSTIRAESLGFEATRTNADTEKMTAGLVTGIVSILDSTAIAFGKTAGYTAATAFADDTSKDGAWGALLIGKLGEKIIDWQDTKSGNWAPKVFADGAAGQTQYLAALSASVRTALDDIGLPSWAQTMLDGLGAAPAIEDIAKVVDSINITQRALVTMGERMAGFANLSDDTASALIKASGGIDALANNASAFYGIYYDEGEKAAATTKQVTEALAAAGLAMPATQKAFREQVEAQLALGAAGAPAVAALLSVAGTFAQLNPVLEATAAAGRAAADILNERIDLQRQLDQLTMSSADLLAQQRTALDESNRSLFDQVQAAQAAKVASDAAAVAAKDAADAAVQAVKTAADALASVNQGYQQQIDALVKASLPLAQQRALEVAGMDASTLALYERLEALKGDAAASAAHAALMESNQARADAAYSKSVSERQAAESAAAAQAQALMNQRVGMETTLYNLTHTASEQVARSRGLELASMDATLRPLQSQIFAMQDQASAAAQAATALENAAAAARAIASERGGLQREMFQMQGDTAALRKLELEAIDPSNRALKESIFALQDKMAADQAAAQAAAAAAAMAQQMAQAQAQAQAQAADEQRRAVEEQARAAEQLKSAWQGITTSIFDEVARIRGLLSGSDTSLSSAQTKFAIATAQARSGDQEAARLLPQLSQAMLQIADATAITALDLRRIQAQTAASLSQTGMGLTSQYGLSVPSYDVGTDYVPRTGLALIHEGEKITPAAYNRPYTRDQSLDTSKLEAAVERLTATVERQSAELAEIKRSTRRSADTLDVVTEGGSAMRTTV